MKDLTKGKPSRLILAFAIPIFMANILQLTYSIVDTRIVGSYLGENSLAAVGATTTLSNLMIGFLMGMAVSWICHYNSPEVWRDGLRRCNEMRLQLSLRALGDTVTAACYQRSLVPGIFAKDCRICKCIKRLDATGCGIYQE